MNAPLGTYIVDLNPDFGSVHITPQKRYAIYWREDGKDCRLPVYGLQFTTKRAATNCARRLNRKVPRQ